MNVSFDVVHYVTISVYNPKGRVLIENMFWSELRWDLRIKYDWYFKYRSALLQVKYPRYVVEFHWGHKTANGKSAKDLLTNRIRSKKAKITEYTNKLSKAESSWTFLFPIEDDLQYQKCVFKIERLNRELIILQETLLSI